MTSPLPPDDITVTRVHTDSGSHIEPPLAEEWDDFTKLRWYTAVVSHDTGLPITIHEGGLLTRHQDGNMYPVPGTYSIGVGRSISAGFDYHAAWAWLNGFSVGVQEADRRTLATTYTDHPDEGKP